MPQENSAHGAQRGGFAHTTPTGFRRLTPALIKADRSAEGFAGLPEGVELHGQLLAAFKAAAPRLGVFAAAGACASTGCSASPSRRTGKTDSRPIVWPSAQRAAGSTRSRALASKGDQSPPDRARPGHHEGQPQRKRYGRRHEKTERILEAYGFDLSLFAARHAEFSAAGQGSKGRARSHGASTQAARRSRARPSSRSSRPPRNTVSTATNGRTSRPRPPNSSARCEPSSAGRDGSRGQEPRTLAAKFARAPRELMGPVETGPSEPENRPHIYNYKPTLDPNKDTVITTNTCSGKAETGFLKSSTPVQPITSGQGQGLRVSLRTNWCSLHQSLSPILRRPDPTGRARRRCRLAAWRSRRLEIAVGRCLSRHGPRIGGNRARDRVHQRGRSFQDLARRVFPRHGRQAHSRRIASRAHRLGFAKCG